MAQNLIKKIQTSCTFPMLKYVTEVKYNEVRKPSGIAYMLLELIGNAGNGNDNISEMLKRFGIPPEMNDIFAKELRNLVAYNVLETNVNPQFIENPKYFEQLTLNLFKMTPNGEKLFSEGAIPTGEKKVKRPTVFFSPVTRRFDLSCTLSYAPIETSYLGKDFFDRVKYDDSGMEDYLNSVRSSLGLKAEEKIAEITPGEPEKLVAKKEDNLTINIFDDGVEFTFSTSDEKAFFAKYYNSALMTRAMLMKTKYKFQKSVPTALLSEIDPVALHTVDMAPKQAQRPCKLFIERGIHGYDNSNPKIPKYEKRADLLDLLDTRAEFALFDSYGCKYYLPLNLSMPCKNFEDTFEIQLLAEIKATDEQLKAVLTNIYSELCQNSFSEKSVAVLSYVASDSSDLLIRYAAKKLSELNKEEERIELLLRINTALSSVKGWAPCFAQLAKDLFDRYIKTVKVENLAFKNTILSPVVKAMQMPRGAYITALTEPLKKTAPAELIYQALESASFSETECLSAVNVIELYAEQVLDRTPIDSPVNVASNFSLLGNNLWKLCDMLGVEDPNEYTLKDDYNIEEFFNAYSTYDKAKNSVKKYKDYAKTSFAKLDRFDSIFTPVHEILSIEKTAAEHPEKITKKFIDEQIARGKWIVAISDLGIKAQYDLRTLLSVDSSLQANELIDEAEKRAIISREVADRLHKLRMCRNGLQHPEARQIHYNKEMLNEWSNTVFALKGENK